MMLFLARSKTATSVVFSAACHPGARTRFAAASRPAQAISWSANLSKPSGDGLLTQQKACDLIRYARSVLEFKGRAMFDWIAHFPFHAGWMLFKKLQVAAQTHQGKRVFEQLKDREKKWLPYRLSATTTIGLELRWSNSWTCIAPFWLSVALVATRCTSTGATHEVPQLTSRTSQEFLIGK